ncbi:type II toxin-antitoxin system VapC family toxin [Nodosilinea sp. FACHB-13]|uniref:type II toxin-antitoxin system VapC family toxin n=1 Tax=Cyanophyceae TaxID=3028117 RepID=UPI0016841364|nr:type II toxin-antitoxin system VapC family toxin [Nodosilinea sp. FACHB-13]MBD2110208.1 type II toxin-antitoxin system VapC family toxin [Nodosilinea sp. FACHB-13]
MLLDTHILLWFLEDNPKLPPSLKSMIEDSDSVFASIVSLWEIAIKLSINKLELQVEFQSLPDVLGELEIRMLPLAFADTAQYLNLPLHHRDPFDRMLIAQAMTNSLAIASADTAFDAYPIQRRWA